jgi:virulence factor Mce-like protein
MRRRRGQAGLAASPVLIGAVTVLVTIVAVFIAYNANSGLPFVPTYDVKAVLPSGAKLLKGNEVRVGGFRVGVVDEITPKTVEVDGERRSVAEISMKLDKVVEPLSKDSTVSVRPRSALGLKYVELTPGDSAATLARGDTIPLGRTSEPLELEDVLSTFDPDMRTDARAATQGFGDAFAGRGESINDAIRALSPLFTHLTPVMQNLADPDTELDEFFLQIGRASAQAAPVAEIQAELFTNMADTFAAFSSDPEALQLTIEKQPPTLDTAIRSFRVQRPFLSDFTDLSRRLRPAAQELPRSLPAVNDALRVGTPILPRTVELNERLRSATGELEDLFENPDTLLSLRDLDTALTVTRPAAEFIAPYQTVCNYFVYFVHPLGEHQSQLGMDKSGTVQAQGAKSVNSEQPNNYGTIQSSRNVDIPPGMDARGAKAPLDGSMGPPGEPLHRLQAPLYNPAIDAQGNADCQRGQEGYPNGPFTTGGRYGPGLLSDKTPAGGNAPITDPDYPILSGGTFESIENGIDNLADVP